MYFYFTGLPGLYSETKTFHKPHPVIKRGKITGPVMGFVEKLWLCQLLILAISEINPNFFTLISIGASQLDLLRQN